LREQNRRARPQSADETQFELPFGPVVTNLYCMVAARMVAWDLKIAKRFNESM
jgi:hypothetical protein